MERKIKISLIAILFSVPIFANSTLAHTIHYRDAFFYADVIVAKGILLDGHVPMLSETMMSDSSVYYWGKIKSRQSQPVIPLFMSIGQLVSSVDMYIYYTHIPLYLVHGSLYYIISKEFTPTHIALPLSLAGMIGPHVSPMRMGGRYIFGIYLLLVIWYLIYRIRVPHDRIVGPALLPVILASFVFAYPRLFIEAAVIVVIAYAVLYRSESMLLLSGLISAAVGFWIIIAVPFTVYAEKISFISLVLVSGTFPSSDPSLYNVLDRTPYGLISLVPLFVTGLLGGFGVLTKVYSWVRSAQRAPGEIILFIWGVSIILFTILHMLTGAGWLSSRYVAVAVPLIVVAAAIGIDRGLPTRYHIKKIAIILIVVSTLISYTLVAGTAWTNIHTYSIQEEESASWADNYSTDAVSSDMAQSSLLVPKSTSARYPRELTDVKSIFYTGDVENIKNRVSGNLFIMKEEMVTDGFYIPHYPRKPMPRGRYDSIILENNVTYTNGETNIISF